MHHSKHPNIYLKSLSSKLRHPSFVLLVLLLLVISLNGCATGPSRLPPVTVLVNKEYASVVTPTDSVAYTANARKTLESLSTRQLERSTDLEKQRQQLGR